MGALEILLVPSLLKSNEAVIFCFYVLEIKLKTVI